MDQKENIWSYTPKKSKKEFSAWLNKFELPKHDFNYDEAYKNIFDDFTKFFTLKETENWENTYLEILDENLSPLKPALSFWYNNLDDREKIIYDKEGFNKKEFDDQHSMMLGALCLGEGTYSIASDSFVRNFNLKNDKKSIFTFYIKSLKIYS